jgi:hypothetical protein
MPELSQINFTHKEVVAALIKAQGLHEGMWQLQIRFGINAMNVGVSDSDLHPSAIVPVLSIGLMRVEKENNLTVNAAQVNPKASGKTKGATKR